MLRDFYVYILFRPNGVPCYVGKGRNGRWKVHFGKRHWNKHLKAIISAAGGEIPVVIIRRDLSNDEACETEIALIKAIGRDVLVNATDGGDGPRVWAQVSRDKASKSAKARERAPFSEEHRANMRRALLKRIAEGWPTIRRHGEFTPARQASLRKAQEARRGA